MDTVVFFGFVGLIVTKATDVTRHFDKNEVVPKGWWILVAWALGIGASFLICGQDYLRGLSGAAAGSSCAGDVLKGIGYGSVASFWHELLSALSSVGGAATNQKGFWNSNPPQGA